MKNKEFIVFPAIDLSNGQVVRLKEGDPLRETAYSTDAGAVARRWLDAGARWLHVVNLDGAFDRADTANRQAVDAILDAARSYGAHVQFGGGMRSLDALEAALGLGVTRAVVGTLAVEQPDVVAQAVSRWGNDAVGASLDARDGIVKVHGWQQGSGISTLDAAQRLSAAGILWLVFTDISRDGLQTGVNLAASVDLAAKSALKVIASGGVRGAEDVNGAREAGLAGVIVGRALYEGSVRLEEVI
jgi:phosphoribosylformimino-5-aminoimidazole carboxamide ribotide isomerase